VCTSSQSELCKSQSDVRLEIERHHLDQFATCHWCHPLRVNTNAAFFLCECDAEVETLAQCAESGLTT
jgi:hypothetical protein